MTTSPRTTPAIRRREQKIQSIKDALSTDGWKIDSWGNWKHSNNPKLRVKFMANNVRLEFNGGDRWRNQISVTYKSMDLQDFLKRVRIHLGMKSISKETTETVLQVDNAKIGQESSKVGQSVNLVLPVANDPDKMKEVMALLEQRHTADYKCYLLLKKGMEEGWIDYDPTPSGPGEHNEFIEECEKAIHERESINDQFLRKMSGH